MRLEEICECLRFESKQNLGELDESAKSQIAYENAQLDDGRDVARSLRSFRALFFRRRDSWVRWLAATSIIPDLSVNDVLHNARNE